MVKKSCHHYRCGNQAAERDERVLILRECVVSIKPIGRSGPVVSVIEEKRRTRARFNSQKSYAPPWATTFHTA